MNEYMNPLAAAWTELFIGCRVCSKGCKEALMVPALGELAVLLSSLWKVAHILVTALVLFEYWEGPSSARSQPRALKMAVC